MTDKEELWSAVARAKALLREIHHVACATVNADGSVASDRRVTINLEDLK